VQSMPPAPWWLVPAVKLVDLRSKPFDGLREPEWLGLATYLEIVRVLQER
jgi:hypothetical protein